MVDESKKRGSADQSCFSALARGLVADQSVKIALCTLQGLEAVALGASVQHHCSIDISPGIPTDYKDTDLYIYVCIDMNDKSREMRIE